MRIVRHHRLRRWLQRLLAFHTSYPVTALACWVLLAAVSVIFTVGNLGFQKSQSALIAQDNRLMRLLKMAERFSDLDAFVVAIENRDSRRSLEFLRKLAPRLEANHQHYDQVFGRVDPARLRPWALLYLGEKDLRDLRDNLSAHQSFIRGIARSPGLASFYEEINNLMAEVMVGHLFTGFLDGGEKANNIPGDLGMLVEMLRQTKGAVEGTSRFASPWRSLFRQAFADEDEEGYFWTEGRKYLLLFVKPAQGKGEGEALGTLRQTVASVGAGFRDVKAGVTGQKALDEDEKQVALKDVGLATSLSLIALAALLIIFWRGIRRPLLAVAVLVVALCITLGLTTLFIGHLNLLSVTFAPMLLGLGIDYGVHWFARYSEERQRSRISTRQAIVETMDKVGPAILLAGLCASLSFFPLVLTGFKGLSELGLICGMGLAVATAASLFLLPTLIVLLDRFRTHLVRKPVTEEIKPLLKTTGRRTFVLVAVAVCVSALSLLGALRVRFDLNMLHLQSKSAESVIWENKLIEGSKYASIYGVLFARSFQEIDEKTRAAAALKTVAKVNSIKDVLPSDQERKIRILREMKPLLAGVTSVNAPPGPVDIDRLDAVLARIRFKVPEPEARGDRPDPVEAQMREARSLIDAIRRDFHDIDRTGLLARLKRFEIRMTADLNDKIGLLRQNMDASPLGPGDLPAPLRDRYVGPDNLYLLRIFPAGNVWDPTFLTAFVRDLRSIDPDATGDPVTLSVFTKAFRDACVNAAIYAVVFIVVFLGVALRSPVSILAALTPLVLGTLWTLGLMHLFSIDLNLANTIFMPLVVGAGVEYGIIVVQRWRQSRDPSHFSLPVSTGTGVILAGLSTTVGFGSLMISGHQGIHSLGVLTTIGSLCVLVAAVLFLPALLHASANAFSGKREGRKDREDRAAAGHGRHHHQEGS